MGEKREINEAGIAFCSTFYLLGENLRIRVAKRGADLSQFGYHASWVLLLIKENVGMRSA